MVRGFRKLLWLELKIFVREPLGLIGTVAIPVVLFLILGKSLGRSMDRSASLATFVGTNLPILASVMIAFSAVLSLVTIISIYRESGILKRLRATPLRPHTILGAHVILKLGLTAVTLTLMILAGRRFYPTDLETNLPSFTLALLLSTLSICSIGFIIASAVPTARFAQPLGGIILYPMLAISGLFTPVEKLPAVWRGIANVLPVTHAVSLLRGIWEGGAWSAHLPQVGALLLTLALCTAIASKIFRWE